MTTWRELADKEEAFRGRPLSELAQRLLDEKLDLRQQALVARILARAYLELLRK